MWQDVLPVNKYCKAMELYSAISEIIGRIAAIENISTKDGVNCITYGKQ